jgi:hypothetical protein
VAGFPDEDLELIVEAAFGADTTAAPSTWVWTELTDRLMPAPVSIRRGAAVGASTTATSFATVQCTNEDGALTPLLPTSPYYPYVDTGTPMRLRLRVRASDGLADTFDRAAVVSGWGAADTGQAWTPSSTPTAFSTTGSAGQISIAAVNTARQIRTTINPADVDVVFDASVNSISTGAATSVGPNLRVSGSSLWKVWPTLEFGLAGVLNARVRTYVNSTSSSTTLVNVPVGSYTANTAVRCRIQAIGTAVRMRVWQPGAAEPDTWAVDITQTTVTGSNGALAPATDQIGLQATVPSTSTSTLPVVVSVDNLTISRLSDRLEGYISDVRPLFTPTPGGGTWSTVQIDISGVGSKLEKNEAPAWSPMRRSIQLASSAPVSYWSLEDAEGSTSAAPALPGQAKMMVSGPAVFSFDQGTPSELYLSRYGTRPIVSVAAGARLTAAVAAPSTSAQWAVSVIAELWVPGIPGVTEVRVLEWLTPGGTYNRWALVATLTGYTVRAYNDAAGTTTDLLVDATGAFSGQITYTIEAVQSGSNISLQIFYDSGGFPGGPATVAATLTAITKIAVNPDQVNSTAAVTPAGLKFVAGHVRVLDDSTVRDLPYYVDTEQDLVLSAKDAWFRETAHQRIGRLCAEERVPFALTGSPATTGSTLLNAQQDGSFTELISRAAESESGGLLFESGFGYRYLPRTARYNQAVALTVDMSTYAHSGDTGPADVLVPQLESRVTNYWTVERAGGSTGSAAADAGYRARRGTIAEQVTVDVLRDDDLDDHAAWRVHLGVDALDAYYPGLPVDLAANPDLIESWLACDIGSRVQRTNQPTIAGYGTIDQVIEGYTELLGPRTWSVTANCSPASVWDVFTLDDPVLGWLNPAGSTLAAGIDATVITLSVAGTAPLWTTAAVYPVDINVGGERMTVTVVTGATSPQTFTVTRGVGGFSKAHDLGTPVTLWTAAVLAL